MNSKLLKLARMVLKFATTMVGDMEWIHDGQLAVGVEVYIEDENGEMIPVADGEYETETMKIVVKDGKIEEMTEITTEPEPEPEPNPENEEEMKKKKICQEETTNPEQTPEPEPQPDEKDAKITELTTKIAELEAKIAVLVEEIDSKNDLIEELQEKLVKPVEQPITMSATLRDGNGKQSGAMKYFE